MVNDLASPAGVLPNELCVLSADSRRQLRQRLADVPRFVERHGVAEAARLLAREPARPHRVALVVKTPQEVADRAARAARQLESSEQSRFNIGNRIFYADAGAFDGLRTTAFLFPGFGARHAAVLTDLYRKFAVVRRWFDDFDAGDREQLVSSEFLFAETPEGASPDPALPGPDPALPELLGGILLANLALFVLLRDLGVRFDAAAGHSYGENAMLIAAGMVPDAHAVMKVLNRVGAATPRTPLAKTSVLAVPAASMRILDDILRDPARGVHVSIENCPQQTVLCGDAGEINRIEAMLREQRQVAFRLPKLTHPVHTPLFPVSTETLRRFYDDLPLQPPSVRAYSASAADEMPHDPDAVRNVLAEQWTSRVRFRETTQRMYADGIRTFIEVGPADRLSGFVRDTLRGTDAVIVSTSHEMRPMLRQLQIALAQLWVRGHDVDLARFIDQTQVQGPSIRDVVLQQTAEVLGLSTTDLLDTDRGFFDLGMSSLGCIDLSERLGTALGRPVPQTAPFDYPTVRQLVDYLGGATPAPARPRASASSEREAIAIVGMACRFPGASTPDEYWQLLREGRDVIREVPPDRWKSDNLPRETRFGGFLDRVDLFDAGFFGISPLEAKTLDPQQRLLLEVAWEALENAAIDPRTLAGSSAGVFVGISNNDYAGRLTPLQRLAIGGYIGIGNTASTAAGRLSFLLGLNGPSMAIDTACSSSLVTVHLGVRSLSDGESDVVLAGGVNVILSPETSILLAGGHALAADGRCKTFDAAADGYVRAEGCGMLVLKRLRDAVAAGDNILAVIRGSAVNHDGRTSGLTVPNGPAQQKVLRRALDDAGIEPNEVGYLEAHGTGTALGDPIEVQALGAVFAGRNEPLIVGSAKTNIGHLEAAAGVAGLMKVVLQLQHGEIVPALHFREPNPKIDWKSLPIEVASPLPPGEGGAERRVRVAGVSSFGISGTNAHVVVEAAPAPPPRTDSAADPVITLSAKSPAALEEQVRRLTAWMEAHPEVPLADIAYTTNVGRAHFRHRRAIGDSELARRWEAGEEIGWQSSGRKVALPTYPFERQRYWMDDDEPRIAVKKKKGRTPAEVTHDLAASILGMPEGAVIDRDAPFSTLGLDSIMALQLSGALQTTLGVTIPVTKLMDGQTLAGLGDEVALALAATAPQVSEAAFVEGEL